MFSSPQLSPLPKALLRHSIPPSNQINSARDTLANLSNTITTANNTGLPSLANLTHILNSRQKIPFVCGYSQPWMADRSGKLPAYGYSGTNQYCYLTSGGSLINTPQTNCTQKAFVCSITDILSAFRSQGQLPTAANVGFTKAWITSVQGGWNFADPPHIAPTPGDCSAWWTLKGGTPWPEGLTGTTVQIPPWNYQPTPETQTCDHPFPFACCDVGD